MNRDDKQHSDSPAPTAPRSEPDETHPSVPAAVATMSDFRDAVSGHDLERAGAVAGALQPYDRRRALRGLTPAQTGALYEALGDERLASLIEELEPNDVGDILRRLPDPEAADVLDEFAPDDAADVLGAIKAEAPERAQPILVEMDRAGDVRALLAYLPDTAGGRMTNEFFTVRPDDTADDAIQAVRQRSHNRQLRGYLYVTNRGDRLIGVLPLYRLVLADPATKISELMTPNPVRVQGTDDQRDASRVVRDHHFLAVPVTDLEGRLIGVITADDIADVLEEEATQDMYGMAGIGVTERATSPVLESSRRRVPWLAFNMAWSLGSAWVVSQFTHTIALVPVLPVFMPVIAGQAGNAGIQTATIVIRSLALGDVSPQDTGKVLLKEWAVGAIKGSIFGLVLAGVAWLWYRNVILGVVAGVSLFLNIAIVASTTGVLLPMTLARMGRDPATIAGVFDTMLSDLFANLIYLGLATLLIAKLM